MKKVELKESEANLVFQTAIDKLVIRMLTGTIDTIDGLTELGKTTQMKNWTQSHINRGLIRKCVFGKENKDYSPCHKELITLFNEAYEYAVDIYNDYKKDMEHNKLFKIK